MNEKKICFITCVRDLEVYQESLLYIKNLIVPEGYEIDSINITEVDSVPKAYNAAMNLSDAKYKVYIHENIFIINKNFIQDILNIFKSNTQVGLISMVGTKMLSCNYNFYDSDKIYGKVYTNKSGIMELTTFNEINDTYEEVQCIDGFLITTQYDIPWREDIFDGWEYYDLAQSTEFLKKGYKVVIPNQKESWCIKDCMESVFNKKERYKDKFKNEYTEFLYPLVSILIPVYNQTKYLKEALESAINQTYPNIEIIIGDDSTNNRVEEFVKPYLDKYRYITYFKNEREEVDYGYINHINCLKKSHGEYINYLNHDDIFHPKKIEYMMYYFLNHPNMTLVTSTRQPIDENGNPLSLKGAFSKLLNTDTILPGNELSRMVIKNLSNFIGEPTTVLFKRKYIIENELNYFNGVRFKNIGDVANWFTLLQYGNAAYLSDSLSCFRIHSNQNSNKPVIFIQGVIAWYQLIKHSYETGLLQNLNECKVAINKWLTTFIPVVNRFVEEYDYVDAELKDELVNSYKEAIDEIVRKKISYNFECPICNNKVERFLPYQYKKHKSDFTSKYQIIGSDTDNFSCPHCYSHDRMRHIVIYFNHQNIWGNYIANKNVLHIAPEMQVQQIISKLRPKKYICGDLYPSNDSIEKINITNIQYEDNYFDFIMCNHVLEHITDDLQAMKELYRVLKKGGCGILQTPYSPIIEHSFEDNTLSTDAERLKFYGQSDHVRIYGLDFFDRLKSVGFKLNIIKNDELFTVEECKQYGVNYREDLIVVSK